MLLCESGPPHCLNIILNEIDGQIFRSRGVVKESHIDAITRLKCDKGFQDKHPPPGFTTGHVLG